MRKFLFFVLLFSSLTSESSKAQLSPQWINLFDPQWNVPFSMYNDGIKTDKNGNTFVLGFIADTNYLRKSYLIKYNTYGATEWIDTLLGIGDYSQLTLDRYSNVYVTGRYNDSTGWDFLTRKYNPSGNIIWTKIYDDSLHGNDQPWAIYIDDDLNVYVSGSVAVSPQYENDIFLIKYNSNGDSIWSVGYSEIFDDYAYTYANAVDYNKNVYVLARSLNSGLGSTLLLKYDSSGNFIWKRRYGTDYTVCTLMNIFDNEFIYLGGSYQINQGSGDFLCVKYDTSGTLIWDTTTSGVDTFSFDGNDAALAMAVDDSGNIILSGCQNCTSGNDDALTIKINADGNILWKKVFSATYTDWNEVVDVEVDKNGNIFAVCDGQNLVDGVLNLILLIYDKDGNEINIVDFSASPSNFYRATSLEIDSLSNIYLGGTATGSGGQFLITLKYSNSVGITTVPEIDFTIYPNPASNELIVVSGSLLVNTIEVVDVLGRIITNQNQLTTNNYQQKPNNFTIDVSDLAEGIYFLRLITSDHTIAVKKFVVVH